MLHNVHPWFCQLEEIDLADLLLGAVFIPFVNSEEQLSDQRFPYSPNGQIEGENTEREIKDFKVRLFSS
jgi:hypothetical protein